MLYPYFTEKLLGIKNVMIKKALYQMLWCSSKWNLMNW